MADYHRMEWQFWMNWAAQWGRYICILGMVDEVFNVIVYHFPLWADIAIPVTFLAHQILGFIQRHTDIYRIDI
jgi:hypothetical protein